MSPGEALLVSVWTAENGPAQAFSGSAPEVELVADADGWPAGRRDPILELVQLYQLILSRFPTQKPPCGTIVSTSGTIVPA